MRQDGIVPPQSKLPCRSVKSKYTTLACILLTVLTQVIILLTYLEGCV
jgi:hypothetical protein